MTQPLELPGVFPYDDSSNEGNGIICDMEEALENSEIITEFVSKAMESQYQRTVDGAKLPSQKIPFTSIQTEGLKTIYKVQPNSLPATNFVELNAVNDISEILVCIKENEHDLLNYGNVHSLNGNLNGQDNGTNEMKSETVSSDLTSTSEEPAEGPNNLEKGSFDLFLKHDAQKLEDLAYEWPEAVLDTAANAVSTVTDREYASINNISRKAETEINNSRTTTKKTPKINIPETIMCQYGGETVPIRIKVCTKPSASTSRGFRLNKNEHLSAATAPSSSGESDFSPAKTKRVISPPTRYQDFLTFEDPGESVANMETSAEITSTPNRNKKTSLQGLSDADKYRRIRIQNNLASKKCREKNKIKALALVKKVQTLEEDNRRLNETITNLRAKK